MFNIDKAAAEENLNNFIRLIIAAIHGGTHDTFSLMNFFIEFEEVEDDDSSLKTQSAEDMASSDESFDDMSLES